MGPAWAPSTDSLAGGGGTQRPAASAPAQLFAETRLIIVAILSSHLHKPWEQRFPRGRTLRTAADTYRSRGVPWLLLLWVVTGDHIAAACLRNPELLDSPGVGSHCGQSAPIAYGSVCRKTDPNQARQGTMMPKLTFLRSKNCDRCPAPREAALCAAATGLTHSRAWSSVTVSPRGGTAVTAPAQPPQPLCGPATTPESSRTNVQNGLQA